MSIIPVEPTIFAMILILTLVFDLFDLQPQIGSFRFLASSPYIAYYAIRVIFGVIASVILETTQLFTSPLTLAFISVIASVTTLQNFSLKLGGEKVADLPSLFKNFRDKMIEQQLKKASQKTFTEQINLCRDLAEKSDLETLKKYALLSLHSLFQTADEKTQINEKMDEIEQISAGDEMLHKMLLARQIVDINPDSGKLLLEKLEERNEMSKQKH